MPRLAMKCHAGRLDTLPTMLIRRRRRLAGAEITMSQVYGRAAARVSVDYHENAPAIHSQRGDDRGDDRHA